MSSGGDEGNGAGGRQSFASLTWVVALAVGLIGLAVAAGGVGGVGRSLTLSPRGGDRPAAELGLPVAATLAGGPRRAPLSTNTGQWVNPASAERPWSDLGAVEGLLGFRGNPTRTFHGTGPVPERPEVLWSTTIGCSTSVVGGEAREWCGTGWTGQPVVFRSPEVHGGDWWVAVGGYDRSVSFFDPDTGAETFAPYVTGDIIKGTVAVDPDGFPLLYTGSRDNHLHVVALDRDQPEVLWRLSADDDLPTLWNNDWDSSPMVIDDHLFIGGENSRFYGVRLNRAYGPDGGVTVDPEVVFSVAGWDADLLGRLGDRQVSIEGSVAVSGDVAYFSNSGGLVQGWDLGPVKAGAEPVRVFDYWTGDDTDATVVVDGDGMVYVTSEFERGNQRSRELGQVFKLDPSRPDDPLVWSQSAATRLDSGVWATPALAGPVLVVATDDGRIIGFDRVEGSPRWTVETGVSMWASPVVVDGVLIQGDCGGGLTGYRLRGVNPPERLWQVDLPGCVESTPAVWGGRIYVGTRDGSFHAIGERG